MKRHGKPARPRSTWIGRLLRGLRFDRNPLRRGSDRVETAILGLLLAAFLAGAPFAAHAAGSWAHAASVHQVRVQQTQIHQVTATLLQDAPAWTVYTAPDTLARWRAPDGQVRTGELFAQGGAKAGNTMPVWVTRTGELTDPPLPPSEIAGRTDLAEEFAVAGLVGTLIVIWSLARRSLYRHRMAGWDADWLASGPRWSPRR